MLNWNFHSYENFNISVQKASPRFAGRLFSFCLPMQSTGEFLISEASFAKALFICLAVLTG